MESVQGPDQDRRFIQVPFEGHPLRKDVKELVHQVDDERHEVLTRGGALLRGEGLVEGGDDEADVAEEGVAAEVDELENVHRCLVGIRGSLNTFLNQIMSSKIDQFGDFLLLGRSDSTQLRLDYATTRNGSYRT